MTQQLLVKRKCCISDVDVDYGMGKEPNLLNMSFNGQWELTRAVAFQHLSQAREHLPLKVSVGSSPPLLQALW